MAEDPLFLASRKVELTQFVPAFSTRPRILWRPGANGSEIFGINVASDDAGANNVQFAIARRLTTAASMGTGSFIDNGASADAIQRTTGSFITDGWKVGDRLMVQDATTIANDFLVLLTAVNATSVLLATGGGTVAAAEDLPSAAALYRLGKTWGVAVGAGAGTPGVNAVNGLNPTLAPTLFAQPDTTLPLGPTDFLVAWLTSTLIAGETADITVLGGDY